MHLLDDGLNNEENGPSVRQNPKHHLNSQGEINDKEMDMRETSIDQETNHTPQPLASSVILDPQVI